MAKKKQTAKKKRLRLLSMLCAASIIVPQYSGVGKVEAA